MSQHIHWRVEPRDGDGRTRRVTADIDYHWAIYAFVIGVEIHCSRMIGLVLNRTGSQAVHIG